MRIDPRVQKMLDRAWLESPHRKWILDAIKDHLINGTPMPDIDAYVASIRGKA